MKLFSKIALVISANAHAATDAVIDMNVPAVVKQKIRELETSIDTVKTQLAVATGQVALREKEIANLTESIGKVQENIDLLLSDDNPENDAHAIPLQMQVDGMQKKLEDASANLASEQETVKSFNQTRADLTERHAAMVSQLQALESADRTAKAKEQAASALEQAGKMTNIDTQASVDNYARHVEERAATADARLKQAFQGTASNDGDAAVALASAKEALQKRKAELAKKTEAA